MSEVAVVLKYADGDGYFDQLYKHRMRENWLTSRNILYTFTAIDSYAPEIPYAVILDEQDAMAFKLRFGL